MPGVPSMIVLTTCFRALLVPTTFVLSLSHDFARFLCINSNEFIDIELTDPYQTTLLTCNILCST